MNSPQLHSSNSTAGFLCCPFKWSLIEKALGTRKLARYSVTPSLSHVQLRLPFLRKLTAHTVYHLLCLTIPSSLHPFPNFYRLFFLRFFMCVCVWVSECTQVPVGARRGHQIIGTGVMDGWELPAGDAENLTHILGKNSKHSQLLHHLSSPTTPYVLTVMGVSYSLQFSMINRRVAHLYESLLVDTFYIKNVPDN